MSDCVLDPSMRQADGCYPISYLFAATTNCTLPPETVCFSAPMLRVDEGGQVVDNEFRGSRRKKASQMSAHKAEKAEHVEPAPAPAPESALAIPAAPEAVEKATKAIVEQPAVTTAANELSGIIGHDVTGMQVVMATVAVAGGGAAWRFYNNHSKRKHEERMAKLEQKGEKKSEKKKDDHGSCTAARVALEARVAAAEAKNTALESKLAALEKKASESEGLSFDGFDPEDLESRIKKIERKLKKLAAQGESEESEG